jgi:hypothetical protein
VPEIPLPGGSGGEMKTLPVDPDKDLAVERYFAKRKAKVRKILINSKGEGK